MKTRKAKLSDVTGYTVPSAPAFDKSQHTPTPWREISSNMELQGRDGCLIGELYGTTKHPNFPNPTIEQRRANAAFIVRAVNAQEELLLALEEVKAYLVRTGRRDARSYVEQIAEAIAKAEGKQ